MKEGEEWKTAFRTRCQALINNTLREMLDISVIAYLDDILIFSKTKKEYIKYVKKVLTVLAEKNLQINLKKCEWHKKEVEFLGFRIEKHEIRILLKKIKIIFEWPRLTIIKHVQEFFKFANYNRQFIKKYLKKITLFTNFIKKEQKFH